MSLLTKLVNAVTPRAFYEQLLGQALPAENAKGDVKIPCPFHEKRVGYVDETGSFCVNMRAENGGYYQCFGGSCGARGTMLNFYEELRGVADLRKLAAKLIEEFGLDPEDFEGAIIDQKKLVKWIDNLHNTEQGDELYKHLKEHRMLSDLVIDQYRLGMNEHGRLTIPVLDAGGSIVDVRGWLPEYRRKTKIDHNTKMISITSTGLNRLYPDSSLKSPEIILAAGELDTLALLSQGMNAITGTAGEGKFNKSWVTRFTDKDITLLLDADNAGQMATDDLLRMLYKVTAKIKAVTLDWTDEVKDVTDYIRYMGAEHARNALSVLISNTPIFYIKDEQAPDYKNVTLYSAGTKELINKRVSLIATIIGNESTDQGYYAIPKRIRCTCRAPSPAKNCIGCPHIQSEGYATEKLIELDSADVIALLNAGHGTRTQQAFFKKLFNVENCRNSQFEIDHNDFEVVEPLLLIPDSEIGASDGSFFQRTAYHVGHGLRANQRYRFRGRTVVDQSAHVTHVFDQAELVDKLATDLGPNLTVTLDSGEETVSEHLSVFQPEAEQHPTEKLREIYSDLRTHVTRVIGRDDVCQAYDLVYHSPISFNFGDRYVHWGWLSAFIFGDTQCGKTESFIKLRDHYRLGHLYNGESISRAGIVGAYAESPGRRGIMYRAGVGPRNDCGLMAIDEFTGLKTEQIDELTHMRSSGKAQSTKVGMDNSYDARVRMIAIANPRENREMATFNPGCKAVKQIIGGDADVARFDIFVAVSRDEVRLDDIHAQFPITSEQKYTSDLCNLLLQWVWSRKPSDYLFTENAQKLVRETATEMGNEYDPSIPIIAPGSHHWTIARIAASIAARLYSTDDGFKIIVDLQHVEAAKDFLRMAYNKPAMGYNVYSAARKKEENIADVEALKKLLDVFPYSVYRALTSLTRFTKRELEDESNLDTSTVRELIHNLRILNAVFQTGNHWYTTKAFRSFALNGYQHPREASYLADAVHTVHNMRPMYDSPAGRVDIDGDDSS